MRSMLRVLGTGGIRGIAALFWTICVLASPSYADQGSIQLVAGGALVGAANPLPVNLPISPASTINVTQFGSSNVVTGTGAGGAGIPRVTVSLDSTVGLVAGTAIVGKFGIDQTTPGTTNGVQVNAALPTGANSIGQVTANAGTNLNTSLLALEAGGNLAQHSTDFGAPGAVACATDTSSCNFNQLLQRIAQRLSTVNTTLGSPFQAGGALAANQSVNVNQVSGAAVSTAASGVQKVGLVGNAGATFDAAVGAGTAPTNMIVGGGIYNSTLPSPTTGQSVALQLDAKGQQLVDLNYVGGAAVDVASSGRIRVGISGGFGGVLDAAGQNIASPPNELLVGCQFNTSPTTITSGNVSPCQFDNAANILVNLKTAIPAGANLVGKVGIDQTTPGTTNGVSHVAAAVGGYSYAHIIAGQATSVVKASAGTLHAIVFNSAATATNVTNVCDNASSCSSGTIGAPAVTAVTAPTVITYDLAFANGLTIVTSTANGGDMTVIYK